MIYEKQPGVPKFECFEYEKRKKDYVVLIPIINEGERIKKELQRAAKYKVSEYADIVICDGGSSDGCTEESKLKSLQVNTLLVKQDVGKQGAQLRMGIWWALQRGYEGIIRTVSVKLIHAPIISLTAHQRFTDTTNAYRAYSRRYLTDERVQPLRDVFMTYELLAYLSVRATQIGYKACESPVKRAYPKTGKTPTKISFFKGNSELMSILLKNARGAYNPKQR